MTSVVVTQTTINASVTQQSTSVSVTSTPINVTISPVDINSHSAVTLGTANGLSLVGQVLSLALSSAGSTGALSSADWSTFNGKLSDAPSDGTTYGRRNAAWIAVSSGVTDHAALSNLSYAASGHTGFQASLGYTPVDIASANYIDLTDGGATTLHSHAGGGSISGSGVVGQLAEWVTNSTTLQAAKLIAPTGAILTLINSNAKSITFPGSTNDTVAMLATANDFSVTGQTITGSNASTPLLTLKTTSNSDAAMFRITTSADVETYRIGHLGQMLWTNASTQATFSLSTTHARFVAGSGGDVQFWADSAFQAVINYTGMIIGGVANSDPDPTVKLHLRQTTATTNAIAPTLRLESIVSSTGVGAAGFGTSVEFYAETATNGTNQQQGLISTSWIDATNASRKATLSLYAYDTVQKFGADFAADGTLTNAITRLGAGAGKITFSAASDYTLTVPATGTAGLLGVNNTWTGTNIFTAQGGLRSYLNGITSNFIAGEGSGTPTMTGIQNVFIGLSCGNAITSGAYNVGIGSYALERLTTGSGNFALGRETLIVITTTNGNVAIGESAFRIGASLQDNVGIGAQVGQSVSGNYNVFLGVKAAGAGGSVRNGVEENVVIGYEAGYTLNADCNVIMGAYAASTISTGSRNIILGFSAGYRQTTNSDLIIIDNTLRVSAAVEAENAYLYGSMAAGGYLQLNIPTTTNNAVKDTLKLQAYVSTGATGAANGFGVGLPFYAETATDATYQQQGLISTSWIDATNASRKAKMSLSAYDTAARLGMEIEASGTAAKISFYGGTNVVRGAALTTQLTTITFTAPTPDYAIQNITQVTPYGFATQDEGNTVLSVIANLQTRVAELEARLGSATGVNIFA